MDRSQFLAAIAARQSDRTNAVKLSIGHVCSETNQVRHDSVTIHEAPPAFFTLVAHLVETKAIEGHNVSIVPSGLRITFP